MAQESRWSAGGGVARLDPSSTVQGSKGFKDQTRVQARVPKGSGIRLGFRLEFQRVHGSGIRLGHKPARGPPRCLACRPAEC
eukprot:366029-Chlamydomonas_euryale.AAC.41